MKKTLLSFLFFCCLTLSYAQSGVPDPSFGNRGIIKTDMGSPFNYNSSARQVLIGPGGSIYIILNGTAISKRLLNGSIDSSYGLNGYSAFLPLSDTYSALQPDGKIVMAGSAGTNSFTVARINANGTRDSTFGNDGIQTTQFAGSSSATSIVIQSDGKIVVAGYTTNDASNTYFAIARYNANGSSDNTFNGTGQSITDFKFKMPPEMQGDSIEIHNAYAYTIAIQADGKILAGGYAFTGTENDFAIARYNSNGSPDNTFDNDGRQTTNFGSSNDIGYSLAIQKDGKILLAGYTSSGGNNNFAVVRYNINGGPDNTFNGNGKQIAHLGSDMQIGNSLALQTNGKIVVAGYTLNGTYTDFAIARFNVDGSPDTSFDSDGLLTTDFTSSDDYAGSLAIQSDDKIIVAGYSYIYSPETEQQIAVARYNPDGGLDNSFSDNGKLSGDNKQGYTSFNATAIQTDGKIVAAGSTWNGSNYDFAIARYNTNGSLDNTFSNDGKQTTDFGGTDSAISIKIQPDGKIVVGGNCGNKFAIARYNANGTADNTFSDDGKQVISMGFADVCQSIALQTDGKIVVAGYTFTDTNYDSAFFAIARLNSNGTLDNTFSDDGKQLTDFDSSPSFAASVAIQKDGKIVVGGRSYLNNQNNFSLARYNNDGSLDNSFSQDGKQNNVFGPDGYNGQSLAIQNDGKIILAGYSEEASGNSSSFALARYKTNGDLDSIFGYQGFQSTSPGAHFNFGRSVAINNDGRIAVAGTNDYSTIVLYKKNGTLDSTFGVLGIKISNIGIQGSSIQSIVFSNNKLYAAGTGQFPGTFGVIARYLFAEGGSLPVSLVDLKAVLQNKIVLLQWQTASEQDLSGFVIERSADGNYFSSIDYVVATGNSSSKINYSTADKEPLQGVNFYRLKMVDKDGKIAYSKIVSVTINDEIFSLNVFPSPAANILFMRTNGKNEKATFQIINADGKILKQENVFLNGNTPFPVYISVLPKGAYILQLHTKTKTQTRRFIKE
ncbi:MAG: T9SS type A sorting domain-containing protein [Ferruginibacter sp.]